MSKTDTFENALLLHIFQNLDIANIGDAAGLQNSTAAGNLTVALHTADPGETGLQTTSETSYTSYARQNVARSGAGWAVTGNQAKPVANISFPQCTGGTATITHFSVGGGFTNNMFYKGTVTPNISVSTGITPVLTTDTVISED